MIPEEGEIEIYPLNNDILKQLCRDWAFDDCTVCLEKVGVMPHQGVVSMGTFMRGVGFICGVLEMAFIPYQEIQPQKWKKEFGCNLGKEFTPKQKKDKDIEVCKKLYPKVSLKRTEKSRTDDDGFADALLMATYARRRL